MKSSLTTRRAMTVVLSMVSGLGLAACSSGNGNNPSSATSTTSTSTTARTGASTTPSSTMSTAESGSTTTTAAGGGTAGSGATGAVLGLASAWGPSAAGFGTVRPAQISLGGDPTGLLTGITWSAWGGGQATGSGTSTYVGPNQTVAQGTPTMASVEAYGLGECGGKTAYTEVVWWFPSQGQTFATASANPIGACTGP